MKRKIEFATQRLKKTTSLGKARSNPTLTSTRLKLDVYSRFGWSSPLNSVPVYSTPINESFDTCIFPATDLNSTKSQSITKTAAIQTDSPCFSQESLVNENISLANEIAQLRKELNELKSVVKDMQKANSLNKMRANDEIIQQLQKENSILKQNFMCEKDKESFGEYFDEFL
ncbi:hypothetical protein SteCoe_5783 [Stentor coeruleus]|uniref:Uncharacterized protein n=1 Tax=Stentor coeruleus TaxID=5963 RepID=A0A1R2CRM8_9CILI|nr:hypothetical protein SteCoe_5783 [Stentor coeruleus]